MEIKAVSLRMDAAIVKAADEAVQAEEKQTGVQLTRTAFISRAVKFYIDNHACKAKKAGAKGAKK